MNAFVRQLAVLAGLWALCGLLLPEGRQQRMVHMAVSLMVMAALIGTLDVLLGNMRATEWPALAVHQAAAPISGYDRIALTSIANQASSLCSRTARKAGYEADAVVYLRTDGSLEGVELRLKRGLQPPLITEDALCEAVAKLLGAESGQVCWLPPEEAIP